MSRYLEPLGFKLRCRCHVAAVARHGASRHLASHCSYLHANLLIQNLLKDWELKDDVQQACQELWPQVTSDNLFDITDYASYKQEFLKLFGFTRDDV